MSEPRPPLPQSLPPIDYRPPQPPPLRPESSRSARIGLFILGLIGGPLLLVMLCGFCVGVSNEYGAIFSIGMYVSVMVLTIIYRKTRSIGIGMLLGPVIVLFSLAVICGAMLRKI